jgi:N-acetylglucosamine kinase-like BadF-type ATPase
VVAAGTGAVALASDGRDNAFRTDGAGYLIGDAGSGFWIGRAGLECAVRARDGRDGSKALLAAAEERFGDLETLPLRLAGDDDRVLAIASFAESVARAARDGDSLAGAIWATAGRELAASAAAALAGCGLEGVDVEVALTGSLRQAGSLLLAPFEAELASRCPRADPVLPRGNALDGALQLASASLDAFGALAAWTNGG